MKFIPVEKARLKINDEVFVQMADGSFGFGRLVERKETADGLEHTFFVSGTDCVPAETTNVKYVAVPKPAQL